MKETRREGEEGESGREGTAEGVRKREKEVDREGERKRDDIWYKGARTEGDEKGRLKRRKGRFYGESSLTNPRKYSRVHSNVHIVCFFFCKPRFCTRLPAFAPV